MTAERQDAEEGTSGKRGLYSETIALGKTYHGIMCAVILMLGAVLVISALRRLSLALIPLGLIVPFVVWVYWGCRKIDLTVTPKTFEVRWWLARLSVSLDEIVGVWVREKVMLPPPYQGHIKVGYGWHSWRDLKVVVCQRALPVVEITTRDGTTIIVTPSHAEELAFALHQQVSQDDRPRGTEPSAPADVQIES